MHARVRLGGTALLLALIGGAGCVQVPGVSAAEEARPAPAAEPAAAPPAAPAAAAPATAETAQQAIEQAEEARKKAAAVSGEWRDTASLIEKARAALKAGEFAEATKLAGKARKQGEAGYAQMMGQQEFRWPSYLKK